MQRRRIERLGRMAVQAAWWCSQAETAGVPLVFASRHGDVQRSFELLEQLARGEPMSPTHFGLSVHNAIAALYSIVRGERGNYLALAAGRATAEAALVEAAGLLADGAPEVLVVVYDARPPAAYASFLDEPDPFYAWSWRVRADGEGTRLSLAWAAEMTGDDASAPEEAPSAARTLIAGERWLGDAHDETTVLANCATLTTALPAGLDALLDLMGQAFDGGTDVQTPIERAIEQVQQHGWEDADVLIVSDGEFGLTGATLTQLRQAKERLGLRVHGILIGDRETIGLLEVCDHLYWVREWRRYGSGASAVADDFSPVHSRSLTALYFPNAIRR